MADGDIKLSQSPNVDTALVEKDGTMLRAVLQETPAGTLVLSDSPNVDTGYIIDEDGNKHKVHLVASPEGTLETDGGINSGKGYIVDGDGKKHRVSLIASLNGGTEINNEDISITANGTYTAGEGYTGIGTATVNVPDGVKYGATSDTFLGDVDANGVLQNATLQTDLVFTGVKDIGSIDSTMGVFFRRFQNLQSIRSISFPDLEDVTAPYAAANGFRNTSVKTVSITHECSIRASNAFQYMFQDCTLLTTADLSGIKEITTTNTCGYMFSGCSALTTVNLSGLITANGGSVLARAFQSCSNLTSLDISNLETVRNSDTLAYMCDGCSRLPEVRFTSLKTITSSSGGLAYAFRNCTALTDIYFNSLESITGSQNCFNNMLYGVTGCTIHFPAALDPQGGSTVISSLTGYPSFAGTNTTLLYDL